MPKYTPEITVSARVANLVRDAALRSQDSLYAAIADAEAAGEDASLLEQPLNPLNWFIEETRKLAVSIARAEYYEQKKATGDPSKEAIDSEVTT